ncbi:MAG: multicopper oxidase domain-containing protein [Gammaproteobacteria bacterium]|nr:multicopper oxidase domain-containing protein [Gammaproteobacteria bacterium]
MNKTMKCAAMTLLAAVLTTAGIVQAATINKTLNLRAITKTMSDGASVTFWGYTDTTTAKIPGPQVEVGIGDTLNLTLSIQGAMGAMEQAPYNGHTIHMHGADVITAEDGVPETGASVMGDTYTFSPTSNMAGSMMYHCHVHTVKHLEMGMYGALVVRPKDASGNFLNQITTSAATAYDYVQTYVFSTVDPAYHTATGDSTVFADYNPKYYLISGAEGKTTTAPALTLAAATNKKVALRLIGIHSVNGTFSIKDGSGVAKSFTVYVQDARSLPTPQTVTSLDVSPGQRYDIIFTTPSTSGTWYPQMTYKKLRDNSTYATAYGKVTF